MAYMLEYKEPYVVKTEQLKNQTCESFRWKQLAMSDDLEALKVMLKKDRRIIKWDTLEVVISA